MSYDPFVGEIRIFAGNFAPRGWAFCEGQQLPISENDQLFSLIGTTYGGDGNTTFALPDLRGRVAIDQDQQFAIGALGGQETVVLSPPQIAAHSHSVAAAGAEANRTSPAGALWAGGSNSYSPAHPDQVMSHNGTILPNGGGQPHQNMMPFLTINFIIALQGTFPVRDRDANVEFFTAEVRMAAFNFAPGGWLAANGQMLQIARYQALFSLLGTTYGGDGKTTFALPNLQGRTAIHRDDQYPVGLAGGEQAHTLTVAELPAHNHEVRGNSTSPNPSPSAFPANSVWGVGKNSHYSNGDPSVTMSPEAISSTGGGQPHQNMSPFLAVNYFIRVGGNYPMSS